MALDDREGKRRCVCGHERRRHGANGQAICDDLSCTCEVFRRAQAGKGRSAEAPTQDEAE